MNKRKIALVVQRYGEDVNGGAELCARWLAEHLTEIGEVHVLTTCAIDYHTWENHYPAGESMLNGVSVHRFPVDHPRDWPTAQKWSKKVALEETNLNEQIEWISAQGPYSTPLFQAIKQQADDFDAYLFFTYEYASTYFGLQLVAEKAILVPTAHDDPFLGLPLFRPLFFSARHIVFLTRAEQKLVHEKLGNQHIPFDVIGSGINQPLTASAERFRDQFNIRNRFLLYIGRIDHSKNVPEVLQQFQQFKQKYPSDLQLILAGKCHIDLPDDPDIRPIGFISEQAKFDALSASELLLMPSKYESLSMVIMEAWLMQKPTLVNGRCEVLKDQTRLSNGGLYYESDTEFEQALTYLLTHSSETKEMGQSGKSFTEQTYDWGKIIATFERLITIIST